MDELAFIEQMLKQVWDEVRRRHADRATLDVRSKKGDVADLVTAADFAVQRQIEAAIRERFPGDVFVAEEAGRDSTPIDPDARCWLLDPIDGTHNFARGMVPSYGVSLAFAESGEVQAGGIALPHLDRLLLAARGAGATCNGQRIYVSEIDDLSAARLEIDFSRLRRRQVTLDAAAKVLQQIGQVRAHGACIVSMAAVAIGAAEAFMHAGPQPWDFAAGVLIITEAGGTVTRFDGSPVNLFDDRPGLVAGNQSIHQQLQQLIQNPRF